MNLYIIIGIAAVIIIGYIWMTYNALVTMRVRIREALSQIDVQLKRRADLIPNLIETVKGYAKHEKSVLENVTKARTSLMNAKSVEGKAEANNALTETLKTLFAVSENYPDLKASSNFQELQSELTDTENKIASSRQFYNGTVLSFNTKIEVFPSNIIAGLFKFTRQDFFAANEEERKNVKVEF